MAIFRFHLEKLFIRFVIQLCKRACLVRYGLFYRCEKTYY